MTTQHHPIGAILTTRPEPAGSDFLRQLHALGFEAYNTPLLEYEAIAADYTSLVNAQALLFTSRHAVRLFCAAIPAREWPVFTAGDATADLARQCGFAQVWSAGGDSNDALRLILSKKKELELDTLVHIAGEDIVQDLTAALAGEGILLSTLPVYRARLRDHLPQGTLDMIAQGRVGTVAFFSARAAENFMRLLEKAGLGQAVSRLNALCLSPRIAAAIEAAPWQAIGIAPTPDLEGMVNLLQTARSGGIGAAAPASAQAQAPHERKHSTMSENDQPQKPTERASWQERRSGAERREKHATVDRRGYVHGATYAGVDRRAGFDRRAYLERQQQRIRHEKMAFIHRSLLTAGLLFFFIVLAGAFIMGPEYVEMRKKAAALHEMEAQMAQMDLQMAQLKRQEQLQREQASKGSLSATINSQIEKLGDVTGAAGDAAAGLAAAAASAAQQAASAAAQSDNTRDLLQVLSNLNTLNASPQGRAAVAQGIDKLKGILAGWSGDTQDLSQAVEVAKKQDPALNSLLAHVEPKDLGAAAMLLTLNEFRGNVNGNRPFQSDLAIVQKFAGSDPEMQKSLQRLAPYAQSGVLDRSALQQEFKGLAMDIVTAKLQGEDLSVQERALKRFNDFVKVRRVDDIEGQSVDAVVARAQLLLDKGDVAGATAELQSLQGAPAQAAAPFIEQAQGHVAAQDAMSDVLSSIMARLTSGGGFSLDGLMSTLSDPAVTNGVSLPPPPQMRLPGKQGAAPAASPLYPAIP